MRIASDVEDALDRLPETLAELYALILDQIQKTEPGGRSIALHTLQWLLCAQVSLSVEQLVDLVSSPARIFFDDVINATDVLSVCCNLVVLDKELNCFRFAHVSVRDFFEGRDGFENDTIHTMAVRRCLDLYDIEPLDSSPIFGPFQCRPSFKYAAQYWIVHYKCVSESNRRTSLKERVQSFFISGRQIKASFGYWMIHIRNFALSLDPYNPLVETFLSVATNDIANPLFTACAFGLPEILVSLEAVDGLDWFQKNGRSETGIHVAARYGFTEVVKFLLGKGVSVHAITGLGETALHRAVQYGHTSAAQLLLENGAHVTDKDFEDWTVLDQAIKRKDAGIVVLLLRHGAKAEAYAKYGQNVASWDDDSHGGVLKLRELLDRPTGFVGILNEGQTGFLNTNLQVFYILKPVREVGQVHYCFPSEY